MGDDKSIHIQGPNFGTNITGDHNIVNQSAPNIIPKVLTNQTGLANDIDFVGRKEELQKVDELLNQNSMLLLLNGIGGIGKSTLASYYLNQHKDNFDYYGFVQVNEDIKLSLASAFGTSLDLKSEKIDDLFAEIMNKLQNLDGKKLLIIDDVKEMDSQLEEMNTLMTLKNSGFQILFTSRETKEYIPQYFLDIMTIEDARELFLKHYPTDEMDKVDKILEYLDYHTLFIELISKIIENEGYKLDFIIKKLKNREFHKIEFIDLSSDGKKEKLKKNIDKLFNLQQLDKNYILLLKRLSVLPSISIDINFLEEIINEDNLQGKLNFLVNAGWLDKNQKNYKLHQMIKEYILIEHLAEFSEIEQIFIFFNNKLNEMNKKLNMELPNERDLNFIDEIFNILILIESKKIKFLTYINTILNIKILEKMMFASKFMKNTEMVNIKKFREFGINQIENMILIIKFFNNLGLLYNSLELYKESIKILSKNLYISKKICFPAPCPFLYAGYINLGTVYFNSKKYLEALPLLKEALNLSIKINGKDSLDTAEVYSFLGKSHKELEEYDKALFSYQLSLEIKNNYDKNIYDIYTDIANIYRIKKNYSVAITYFSKALRLTVKALGKNHPSLKSIYKKLGKLYLSIEKNQKSKKYFKKAEDLGEISYVEVISPDRFQGLKIMIIDNEGKPMICNHK